jgi:uncharacterized membrane protein YeiH
MLVATIGACTGGVVRDVLIQKETLILSNELYVTPVLVGVTSFVIADALGANHLAGFMLAMIVTIAIRVVAIRFHITLPRVLCVDAPASRQP